VILGIVVSLERQAQLLEVLLALHPGRGFADLLHGRQEQAEEDADDGNHDQQLDQGETRAFPWPTGFGMNEGHGRAQLETDDDSPNGGLCRYETILRDATPFGNSIPFPKVK
jgi:hypothetical protein